MSFYILIDAPMTLSSLDLEYMKQSIYVWVWYSINTVDYDIWPFFPFSEPQNIVDHAIETKAYVFWYTSNTRESENTLTEYDQYNKCW